MGLLCGAQTVAKTVHQQTLDQVMHQKPVSWFYTWAGADLQHAAAVVMLPFIPETHILRFSRDTSVLVMLYVPGTSITVTLYVQTQPCGHQWCPLAMCLRYFRW